MQYIDSPIPQICISPAPPQDPLLEPYSPFQPITFSSQDQDGFRPVHLTPPPTVTHFKRSASPLRQHEDGTRRGLETQRFQELLKASKERNASTGGKKDVGLRKEIALKVHKNKQVERRALFLSKVQAPPSPTAATLPKTPPESPAIFHYSLPSPGLVSPLALFESLDEDRDAWVEQVDFRLSGDSPMSAKPRRSNGLPSLDQISARLIPRTVRHSDFDFGDMTPMYTARPRPTFGVGRLKMPLRAQPPVVNAQPKHTPPKSPLLHNPSDLRVTTLVIPKMHITSPVELTEGNLKALNSRDERTCNMLSKLKRRTLSSETNFLSLRQPEEVDVQYKWRRRSAPADLMPCRARIGFEHPVLALPGGF